MCRQPADFDRSSQRSNHHLEFEPPRQRSARDTITTSDLEEVFPQVFSVLTSPLGVISLDSAGASHGARFSTYTGSAGVSLTLKTKSQWFGRIFARDSQNADVAPVFQRLQHHLSLFQVW